MAASPAATRLALTRLALTRLALTGLSLTGHNRGPTPGPQTSPVPLTRIWALTGPQLLTGT